MRRKTAALLLSVATLIWLSGYAGEPVAPPPPASTAPWVPPPPSPPASPFSWLSTPPGEQDITLVSKTPPVYPPEAVKLGHQGTTTVRLVINSKGKIVAVSVGKSSNFPELDQAAVDAAWNWKFRPGWLRGVAVGGVVEVPVGFALSVVKPKHASSTKQTQK